MKHILVKLLILCCLAGFAADPPAGLSKKKVVVFDIKENISPSATRISTKAILYAEEIGADLIIIHMNTYGGYVNDADSIRTRILNTKIPTYVFIDNNAASAGALISLACDKIYMRPGGSIGAATVVTQSGEAAPDKYQSYMRKQMRSTAESHGFDTIVESGDTVYRYKRNPDIAEGMVDESVVVPGLDDSAKVITLTTDEAITWAYCEGKANSMEEILSLNSVENYEIIRVEKSAVDKWVSFFANPALRSILILLMMGGIYFELQSPGIGFPLGIAVLAAIAYFAPLYIDGLAANWEIMLFFVGLILVAVEIFAIPGFGIAGISGIVLMLLGLTLSMVKNVNFDFSLTDSTAVSRALGVIFISLIVFISMILIFGRSLLKSGLFKRLILADTLEASRISQQEDYSDMLQYKGTSGITHTALRPMGKILIDAHIFNAKTDGEFIDKGITVVVSRIENDILIVKTI